LRFDCPRLHHLRMIVASMEHRNCQFGLLALRDSIAVAPPIKIDARPIGAPRGPNRA
jgi:hypothetical protein